MSAQSAEITITVFGLKISDAERELWEKTVADMAAAGDNLSGLDQMDAEPMNMFNPGFGKAEA
ncbi:hypothetical protein [Dethiosulfatarculus sandiegensis]|uniref:Uncharacterized protein n=1 Tax=Dethiosulfatarculus sandiegensis TaxID=1429043 RepID=A0A0D2JE21_9BACT|nr:hypothetical protein [Dethiosulfatarculus sandiegensis]KIX13896.1 hypothetical protein X474_11900 [Dethiosulfatarculus sandiegensis]